MYIALTVIAYISIAYGISLNETIMGINNNVFKLVLLIVAPMDVYFRVQREIKNIETKYQASHPTEPQYNKVKSRHHQ